jgi:endonuclease/exonuclease/phosphatase family metal-dependent hydrolase
VPPPAADRDGPDRPCLRVATLNIRNTADRWRERRELFLAQLDELRPDVIGVQELRRWPSQTRWTTRRLDALAAGAPYRSHPTGKTGLWGLWEGIAVLTHLPILEQGSLDLRGEHRVANWVRVQLADGAIVEFHNAHLSARDGALRDRQARLLLDHMTGRGDVAKLLMGDLNAGPDSSTLRLLGDRLHSAYAVVHGEEPARTWPTPLRASNRDGRVIDYVLVDDQMEVIDAWLAFDRPSPSDPTLFPSDHLGIAATVSVRSG